MLKKIEQLLCAKASLLEDVGERSFGNCRMHRNNGSMDLFDRPFFERNVAALLPHFDKASAFQRADKPLAGNAWQLRHFNWRYRRTSRTVAGRRNLFQVRPKSRDTAQSLRGGWRGPILHPCPAT